MAMREQRWILVAIAASVLLAMVATGTCWAEASAAELDAVAQRMIAQERVAGGP